MYNIEFAKEARDGTVKLKRNSPDSYKKLNILIEELRNHPYSGTGKPEILKYISGSLWSRRIDKKNRLVYSVNEDVITVLVVSVVGHYGDK